MTSEQRKALKAVGDAIIETVRETQGVFGTPGGHLYAALMAQGCTLEVFEKLMNGLVSAGMLRKQGECYFTA